LRVVQDDGRADVDNLQFLFELTQAVMEIKHSQQVTCGPGPSARPGSMDVVDWSAHAADLDSVAHGRRKRRRRITRRQRRSVTRSGRI
jgi:hypothetical protein